MNEIRAIDPATKSWLQNIVTEHWSRFAYNPIIRCDHVTNNMTEAFNSILGSHKAKSYLELLEFIKSMVMRKFQERKDKCEAWNSVLALRVTAKILKNSKENRLFTIIAVGNGEYELLGRTEGYGVKLREYSCQCSYWQMSGVPWSWHLLSPPRTVQPSRPKTQRKRELDEPSKGRRSGTVVCKPCLEPGHNKRTYKKKRCNGMQFAKHLKSLHESTSAYECFCSSCSNYEKIGKEWAYAQSQHATIEFVWQQKQLLDSLHTLLVEELLLLRIVEETHSNRCQSVRATTQKVAAFIERFAPAIQKSKNLTFLNSVDGSEERYV
ncbi:hypothetical protein EZV62_001933 [Acer yangbiense]|uniref:Uncharacterized protein n=1 Tax=Acer yangbiense TaxID=1000413 RepID=A0A5C7IWU6_9ROSI|nr:hypothetical protein EZV62_001933 [Acer yangbiense]